MPPSSLSLSLSLSLCVCVCVSLSLSLSIPLSLSRSPSLYIERSLHEHRLDTSEHVGGDDTATSRPVQSGLTEDSGDVRTAVEKPHVSLGRHACPCCCPSNSRLMAVLKGLVAILALTMTFGCPAGVSAVNTRGGRTLS
jgi:hypothetical protein